MIYPLSLLFLLQIASNCTTIHSGDALKPGQLNGRTVYSADFKGCETKFRKHILNGKIDATYIKNNYINLNNCYNFPESDDTAVGGRGPYEYHYPIEWAIMKNAPVVSLEVLLQNGTPINGFVDYNLLKGILQNIINNCGTVNKSSYEKMSDQEKTKWQKEAREKLALYQTYLDLLFQHNINLDEKFPAHNGHGADEPYGTCKPTEYLPNALVSKKKDTSLIVSEGPFDTIQKILEEEIARRNPALSTLSIKETNQPSWLQSKIVKKVVGVCTLAALFFAIRWLYSKFAGTVRLPNKT